MTSTIKRVLCVALLSATANGLRLDLRTAQHFPYPPDIPKDPRTKLRSPGTPVGTRTYASLTAHAV